MYSSDATTTLLHVKVVLVVTQACSTTTPTHWHM